MANENKYDVVIIGGGDAAASPERALMVGDRS